jgi:uncharacterized protein YfaP (DUF2135 family)
MKRKYCDRYNVPPTCAGTNRDTNMNTNKNKNTTRTITKRIQLFCCSSSSRSQLIIVILLTVATIVMVEGRSYHNKNNGETKYYRAQDHQRILQEPTQYEDDGTILPNNDDGGSDISSNNGNDSSNGKNTLWESIFLGSKERDDDTSYHYYGIGHGNSNKETSSSQFNNNIGETNTNSDVDSSSSSKLSIQMDSVKKRSSSSSSNINNMMSDEGTNNDIKNNSGSTIMKNMFSDSNEEESGIINNEYGIGNGGGSGGGGGGGGGNYLEEKNVHYQYAIGHGDGYDDQTIQPNKEERISANFVDESIPSPYSSTVHARTYADTTSCTNTKGNIFSSDYSDDLSRSKNHDDESMCLVPHDGCCLNRDCINGDDICVHRNCINDGFLRFTLQWIGDDDYDLFVVTPDGTEISYNNFFDPTSMGKFGESVDQIGYGYHVENIYFPLDGAPPGIYTFFVRPFVTVEKSDEWTVTVVESWKVVDTVSGLGCSEDFFYYKEPHYLSPPTQHPISIIEPITPSPTPQYNLPTTSPVMVDPPNRPPLGQTTDSPLFPIVSPTVFPIAAGPYRIINEDCDVELDECCVDLDCKTVQDICEQRTCIKDGNPRFTLIWTGDYDLDLFVITPDGVQISADDTFDIFSGGRYERDVDQSSVGYHVISIYFPMLDSPAGTYEYGVRSSANNDVEDSWTIDIYDEGDLVETRYGLNDSVTFSYFRKSGIDEPQRPDPQPPICSPIQEECCIDADCSDSSETICVQRTCINEGTLRITLEWIGDDDLQLYVETPENTIITRGSDRYEGSSSPLTFGFHVESVYFLTSGATFGTYRVYVSSLVMQGVGSDVWTVRIYESGKLVQEETGIGDSELYDYDRVAPTLLPSSVTQLLPITPVLTSMQPSVMPTTTPVPESQLDISSTPSTKPSMAAPNTPIMNADLCTVDLDCPGLSRVCVQNACITDGNPRFTLQWSGESMYNLRVVTTDGKFISALSPFDPESDGTFEGPNLQLTSGNNMENVYFPLQGGPSGLYAYSVTNSDEEEDDSNASWIITVSVNGENIAEQRGVGNSDLYSFQFGGSIATSNPQSIACETNSDCDSSNICIKKTCIQKGSPQFVLSYIGNSDIVLSVVTPLETTINWQNPFDAESAGKFNDHIDPDNPDHHIENIYFSPEGQPGVYPYYVHSFLSGGEEDTWTVTIYVDGQEISSETGQGSSEVLFYVYSAIDSPSIDSPDQGICDQLTVDNVCIEKGAPQFILSWEGNYDVALSVVTPLKTTINWQNPIDLESGGKFSEYVDPNNPDHRIENIHFAPETNAPGIFPYYVHSFMSDGEEDIWTLSIFVDGEEISSETGQGSSEVLFFDYDSPGMDIPASDQEICDPLSDGECCTNADCFPNEVCASHTCVDEGNPRFTLSWEGANDLDLMVVTPLETVISFSNLEDLESGGKFGEEFDQFEYGKHTENIYFPMGGGPVGQYSFYVRSFLSYGVDDQWTVVVYVDGREELSFSGTGNSQRLLYNFLPLPP